MSESFKREIVYVKTMWPDMDEDSIKTWLRKRIIENDYTNIKNSIIHLRKSLSSYPSISKEISILEELISINLIPCREEEIAEYYLMLKKESFHENQTYNREFHLMGNTDQFTLRWSINKALEIIKRENIQKEYFLIKKMNIDETELEQLYVSKSIHNKKPGILVNYEPYRGSDFFNILIDGNHRVTANKIMKNKSHYAVYSLNSRQSFEALRHPYYQALYLLHLLLSYFHTPQELLINEVENSFRTYLGLKNIVFN